MVCRAPASTNQVRYPRCYAVKLRLCALRGWRCANTLVAGVMVTALCASARAQSLTPDPGAWRPMSYANLQNPSSQSATYSDIWKDAIDANNRAYKARGDQRFTNGNAPVTEAHFVIWSASRSVVLSVLNTAIACSTKQVAPDARATVKLCPMRIAIFEGVQVRTMDGGSGCFLELEAGVRPDREASAAYASYDTESKTVRIGMILNHQAVDGCSKSIPLYPQ
jgi:hypothetical protein